MIMLRSLGRERVDYAPLGLLSDGALVPCRRRGDEASAYGAYRSPARGVTSRDGGMS